MNRRSELIQLLTLMERGEFDKCIPLLERYTKVHEDVDDYYDCQKIYHILEQNGDFCEWVVENEPLWFIKNIHNEVNRHAGLNYDDTMYIDRAGLSVYHDLDELLHEIKCTNLGEELIVAFNKLTESERKSLEKNIDPLDWLKEGYYSDCEIVLVAVLMDFYKKQEK